MVRRSASQVVLGEKIQKGKSVLSVVSSRTDCSVFESQNQCYNKGMKIVNRKLQRDYEILVKLAVGVMLTGPEVKYVREEKLSLDNSHVKVLGNELFLVNADIYPYLLAPKDIQETKKSQITHS